MSIINKPTALVSGSTHGALPILTTAKPADSKKSNLQSLCCPYLVCGICYSSDLDRPEMKGCSSLPKVPGSEANDRLW